MNRLRKIRGGTRSPQIQAEIRAWAHLMVTTGHIHYYLVGSRKLWNLYRRDQMQRCGCDQAKIKQVEDSITPGEPVAGSSANFMPPVIEISANVEPAAEAETSSQPPVLTTPIDYEAPAPADSDNGGGDGATLTHKSILEEDLSLSESDDEEDQIPAKKAKVDEPGSASDTTAVEDAAASIPANLTPRAVTPAGTDNILTQVVYNNSNVPTSFVEDALSLSESDDDDVNEITKKKAKMDEPEPPLINTALEDAVASILAPDDDDVNEISMKKAKMIEPRPPRVNTALELAVASILAPDVITPPSALPAGSDDTERVVENSNQLKSFVVDALCLPESNLETQMTVNEPAVAGDVFTLPEVEGAFLEF